MKNWIVFMQNPALFIPSASKIKKEHSPTDMVRLCFALLLIHKEQDCIHMPLGFLRIFERLVGGEVVNNAM